MTIHIATSGGEIVSAGGLTKIVSDVVVRPANTTQYAENDQVGSTNLVFEVARVLGGSGIITSAILIDNTAETTKPSIDLLLFTSPVTNAADNAAVAVTDSEAETAIGVVSFDASYFKVVGANGMMMPDNVNIPFVCGQGTKTLYGVLAARNAYTPISLEKLVVKLGVLQD